MIHISKREQKFCIFTLSLLAWNMLIYVYYIYFFDMVLVAMETTVIKQPCRKIKKCKYNDVTPAKNRQWKQNLKMVLVLLTWVFYDFMTRLDLTFVFTFYHFFTCTVTQCSGLQPPAQVHGWGRQRPGLQPQPPPSWQSAVTSSSSSSCPWRPVSERPRDGSSWKVTLSPFYSQLGFFFLFSFQMLESSQCSPSHADLWYESDPVSVSSVDPDLKSKTAHNFKKCYVWSAKCFWRSVGLVD